LQARQRDAAYTRKLISSLVLHLDDTASDLNWLNAKFRPFDAGRADIGVVFTGESASPNLNHRDAAIDSQFCSGGELRLI
jgi:hypothetical protein